MKNIGFIKKAAVMVVCVCALSACNVDGAGAYHTTKYNNNSGVDIDIEAYFAGSDQPVRMNILKDTYLLGSRFEMLYGGDDPCVGKDLWYQCDSAFVFYNSQKVQRYTTKISVKAVPNPLSIRFYKTKPISGKESEYWLYFDFTPEMYDAATPINPPAEE